MSLPFLTLAISGMGLILPSYWFACLKLPGPDFLGSPARGAAIGIEGHHKRQWLLWREQKPPPVSPVHGDQAVRAGDLELDPAPERVAIRLAARRSRYRELGVVRLALGEDEIRRLGDFLGPVPKSGFFRLMRVAAAVP